MYGFHIIRLKYTHPAVLPRITGNEIKQVTQTLWQYGTLTNITISSELPV